VAVAPHRRTTLFRLAASGFLCYPADGALSADRQVSTVFQKEILASGRLLFQVKTTAVDEFEMLALSDYQRLNEERRGILQDVMDGGRFCDV